MGKRLREVAEMLRLGAELLAVQPQVIGVAEHLLEEEPRLLQVAHTGEALDVPEGAHRERALLAGEPVGESTGEEGTFSMCSFWYVECLSRMGDLQQARFFFEKMLGYANHLGLYGEELGPQAQHLGNFPQAFTHLALISAAIDLDRRLSAAGHAG